MFGFNRNRGLFNRYNNYTNGPFPGYDNNTMREESFIRKYIIFKIYGRIFGRIFGFIFVLFILFVFFTMRGSSRNNSTIKNNKNIINNSYSNSSIITNNSTYMNNTQTNSSVSNTIKNSVSANNNKNTIKKNNNTSLKNNVIQIDIDKIKNAIQSGINAYNK